MSVFNADAPTIPENPLAELVGEGKKYATADDLAKAYFHASGTIEQRNRELGELRTDLQARMSVEEMLAKISPTPAPTPTPTPTVAHQPSTPSNEPAPDVATLVQQELNKINQTQAVQKNVQEVTQTLVAHFGDEDAANRAVKAKAAELGVSVDFLQDVATKSPKAFFTTIGLDVNTPTLAPARPTNGDVNPQALALNTAIKPGTYAFYENIRKTNPTVYFSPKIQNQMHKEALAKGADFFK